MKWWFVLTLLYETNIVGGNLFSSQMLGLRQWDSHGDPFKALSVIETLNGRRETPLELSKFCTEGVAYIFFERPSWLKPTVPEVDAAIACLSSELEPLRASVCSAATAVENDECEFFIKYLGILTRLLKDPQVEAMKALGPLGDEFVEKGAMLFFVEKIRSNPVLVQSLLKGAKFVGSEARKFFTDLEHGPDNERALIVHMDDYLDHKGYKPESLWVWKRLILDSSGEISSILREEVLKKPAVRLDAKREQSNRLCAYTNPMGRLKRLVGGSEAVLKMIKFGTIWAVSVAGGHSLFFTALHIGDEKGGRFPVIQAGPDSSEFVMGCGNGLSEFFFRISEIVLQNPNGMISSLTAEEEERMTGHEKTEFARTIAGLLYMIKVTRDPLALITE
jgi:hypothetical protein